MVAAGCQAPGNVSAAKPKIERSAGAIIGTRLVGARGLTPVDQDKIDDTVTRICAARVWSQSDCLRHDEESARGIVQ